MRKSNRLINLVVLAGCFMWALSGCANRGIKPGEYFNKLKPVEEIRPPEQSPNLLVRIDNVTDKKKRNAKRVEFFINGERIRPDSEDELNQRYSLILANGIYEVQAKYYASTFWGEKEYKISTRDGKVRIYPDQRTTLSIRLDKKKNSQLKSKKNFFTERSEPLSPRITRKEPAVVKPAFANAVQSRLQKQLAGRNKSQTFPINIVNRAERRPAIVRNTGRRRQSVQSVPAAKPRNILRRLPGQRKPAIPQPAPQETITRSSLISVRSQTTNFHRMTGKIAVQINTIPNGTEVYVDDNFMGQSPLTVYLERSRKHVIQFVRKGYEEKIILLDPAVFVNKEKHFLVQKLETKE